MIRRSYYGFSILVLSLSLEIYFYYLNLLFTLCLSRYDLRSQMIIDELRPFLWENTETFLDELLNFARSPFDMTQYDRYVVYRNSSDYSSMSDQNDGTSTEFDIPS